MLAHYGKTTGPAKVAMTNNSSSPDVAAISARLAAVSIPNPVSAAPLFSQPDGLCNLADRPLPFGDLSRPHRSWPIALLVRTRALRWLRNGKKKRRVLGHISPSPVDAPIADHARLPHMTASEEATWVAGSGDKPRARWILPS